MSLARKGREPSYPEYIPAMFEDRVSTVEALLAGGADVNMILGVFGRSILHTAASLDKAAASQR